MTGADAASGQARVLVTRPREDAEDLNAALRARGFEPLAAPMLDIVPLPHDRLDLDGVQALLFTSANGVRAFAALQPDRDLPAYCVGDATARAARTAEFETVHSAGGDVGDLARLVTAALRPGDGALLHAAASKLAGDLQGRLQAAGFALRRAVLYEARTAAALPSALQAELAAAPPDYAVFFSPRTAATFVDLARNAGVVGQLAGCHAVCLSQAVADRLGDLDWAAVVVAESPTQAALLDALERLAGRKS